MKHRTYTLLDGSVKVFNHQKANEAFYFYTTRRKSEDKTLRKQQLTEDIAAAVSISVSSLKHWLAGRHTPDYDQVCSLAAALNLKPNDLLDDYNENEKENFNMITATEAPDARLAAKDSALRNIYTQMVTMIELYRMGMHNNTEIPNFKTYFSSLYTLLMTAHLDLPESLFQELHSFAVNYLQQMGCYLKFSEYALCDFDGVDMLVDSGEECFNAYAEAHLDVCDAPWGELLYVPVNPLSTDFNLFREAVFQHYEAYQDQELAPVCEDPIADTAHKRLMEILNDFRVK